jgi:hypothetical protein
MQIIPRWDQYPTLSFRDKVAYLTYELTKLPQVEMPLLHIFENGFYIREIEIPAGTLFLGRMHRHGHRCELMKGSLVQVLPDGSKREVHAPFGVDTQAGFHMVLYTLTDVVGRTIHPNGGESRDIVALEDDIFESVEALLMLGEQIAQRLLPSDVAA